MKVIIQRVSEASVKIDGKINGQIAKGFLILLGIADFDTQENIDYLVNKISNLRIFSDENDKMNLSLKEVNGDCLVISQFTLFANTKKGNRPSYMDAARPEIAIPLYEKFITTLEKTLNKKVATGVFGADMKVALVNDGPVTITIEK